MNLGEDVLSSPPTPPPGLCYFQNKMLELGENKEILYYFFFIKLFKMLETPAVCVCVCARAHARVHRVIGDEIRKVL